MCTECEDYLLCFICHGSRDVLHPLTHGSFVDISVDDDSDDGEDKEADMQEEEVGPSSNGTDPRHGSEDGAMNEEGSSPAEWRWEVEENGDIMPRTSDGP